MTSRRSLHFPLETYELTRQDHRDQKTSQDIAEHARKAVAKLHAEEAADPHLRQRRQEAVRRAWTLLTANRTPDHEIMRWRVRLYCGHIVETTRHFEAESPTMHGSSSMPCPDCGLNPARIVAYEPIGLLASPSERATDAAEPSPPNRLTRQQLERRIEELEAKLKAKERSE